MVGILLFYYFFFYQQLFFGISSKEKVLKSVFFIFFYFFKSFNNGILENFIKKINFLSKFCITFLFFLCIFSSQYFVSMWISSILYDQFSVFNCKFVGITSKPMTRMIFWSFLNNLGKIIDGFVLYFKLFRLVVGVFGVCL